MKAITFRLTRSWIGWFVVISSFALVFGYSTYYYKESSTYENNWIHCVSEYETVNQLKEQIEKLQDSVSLLGQELEGTVGENRILIQDEMALENETLQILNYLLENNLSYSEVVEGELVYYFERSQRGYSLQTLEMVFVFLIIVSILIVGQIVCEGRTNGAFMMNYLIEGRRRNFLNELFSGYLIVIIIYVFQVVIVSILRREFSAESTYALFYNGGEIKLLDIDAEFWMMVFSIFIMLSYYYVSHYIIAQLVSNNIVFYMVAVITTIGWMSFLSYFSDIKFICALGITLPDVYANQMSVGYYLVTTLIRVAVMLSGLFVTYKWFMGRNIRTRYE